MDSALGSEGDLGLLGRTGCLVAAALAFGAELARMASNSLMASMGWRLSNAASTSGGKGSFGLTISA